MKTWLLFATILVSLPAVTDYLVDYQFRHSEQNIGYSKSEREGMAALVERSLAKPKHRMSEGEQAMAMKGLLESGL